MTRGKWADTARLAGLALVLTPLTIMLHELGHFSVGVASGLPVQLHPGSVSGGADAASGSPAWLQALQSGAGPAVTVAMSLAATIAFRRRPRRLWLLAFAAAAASRLFVSTTYLVMRGVLLVLGRPFQGTPNFDEYTTAKALGLLPEGAAALATVLAIAVFWALFAKVERGRRMPYFLALAAGIVTANFVWPALAPGTLASIG